MKLLPLLVLLACGAFQPLLAQVPAGTVAETANKTELDQLLTEYETQHKALDAEIEPQLTAAKEKYLSELEALKNKYNQSKRPEEAAKIQDEAKRYIDSGIKNAPAKGLASEVRVAWANLLRATNTAGQSVSLKRNAVNAKFLQSLTPLVQSYRAKNDLDGIVQSRRAYAAVTIHSAVDANRLGLTDMVGGGEAPWQDIVREGGYIVGFEVGKGGWAVHTVIGMLRPIFATARGNRDGEGRGYANGDRVIAKEGYAVGGMQVIHNMLVRRVQIIFMRINPDGISLNPQDSYVSDWMGDDKVTAKPKELTARGKMLVGINGDTSSGRVDSIGLIFLK